MGWMGAQQFLHNFRSHNHTGFDWMRDCQNRFSMCDNPCMWWQEQRGNSSGNNTCSSWTQMFCQQAWQHQKWLRKQQAQMGVNMMMWDDNTTTQNKMMNSSTPKLKVAPNKPALDVLLEQAYCEAAFCGRPQQSGHMTGAMADLSTQNTTNNTMMNGSGNGMQQQGMMSGMNMNSMGGHGNYGMQNGMNNNSNNMNTPAAEFSRIACGQKVSRRSLIVHYVPAGDLKRLACQIEMQMGQCGTGNNMNNMMHHHHTGTMGMDSNMGSPMGSPRGGMHNSNSNSMHAPLNCSGLDQFLLRTNFWFALEKSWAHGNMNNGNMNNGNMNNGNMSTGNNSSSSLLSRFAWSQQHQQQRSPGASGCSSPVGQGHHCSEDEFLYFPNLCLVRAPLQEGGAFLPMPVEFDLLLCCGMPRCPRVAEQQTKNNDFAPRLRFECGAEYTKFRAQMKRAFSMAYCSGLGYERVIVEKGSGHGLWPVDDVVETLRMCNPRGFLELSLALPEAGCTGVQGENESTESRRLREMGNHCLFNNSCGMGENTGNFVNSGNGMNSPLMSARRMGGM